MDEDRSIRFEDEGLQAGWTPIANSILKSNGLSNNAKLLYAHLSSYAWRDDRCWAGQDRLAEEMAMTTRMLRDYLRELEVANLLKTEQRGLGRTNAYVLLGPAPSQVRNLKAV